MLWGAFNNASGAMIAMTSGIGTISQNIANMNTVGYKAKDTEFQTVLSEGHAAPATTNNGLGTATTGLNIFGVQAVNRTYVTKQGVITPTTNWSDLAINGRGFFMLGSPDSSTGGPPTSVNTNDDQSVMYTRAGAFQELSIGAAATVNASAVTSATPTISPGTAQRSYLTTASGQYLLGWQADANGNIAGVATTSHSPVAANVAAGAGATSSVALTPIYLTPNAVQDGVATTAIQAIANIPSNATKTSANSTQDTIVQDDQGNNQTLTATYTRAGGDTWNVAYSVSGGTVTTATPATLTVDSLGNITPTTDASPVINVTWASTATATPAMTLTPPAFQGVPLSMTVYDQAYNPHTVTAMFEHTGNGTWNMRIQLPVASGATTSAEGSVTSLTSSGGAATGAAAAAASTYSVPVTFDGAGNIVSPTTITFGVAWTQPNPNLSATDPSYNTAPGTNTISFDISKMTQLSSDKPTQVVIKTVNQDGYASGVLNGTSFNSNGELIGKFTNGNERTLWMVPVATFTAPDQLTAVSGTVFRRNVAAGDESIGSIASQGSGAQMEASSLEQSNVDLGVEFSRMIITQRAYSTNAQVFKTADEMTTSARDLIT